MTRAYMSVPVSGHYSRFPHTSAELAIDEVLMILSETEPAGPFVSLARSVRGARMVEAGCNGRFGQPATALAEALAAFVSNCPVVR